MTITRLLKTDRVASVPARWASNYANYPAEHNWGAEKHEITRQLLALKGTNFTAEQVDSIIGNGSWTEFKCDECGTDVPVLIRIGAEPDYEARWLDLCPGCLSAALHLTTPMEEAE